MCLLSGALGKRLGTNLNLADPRRPCLQLLQGRQIVIDERSSSTQLCDALYLQGISFCHGDAARVRFSTSSQHHPAATIGVLVDLGSCPTLACDIYRSRQSAHTSPLFNCHPASDRPTQANDIHPHEPFTRRDVPCVSCHTDRNFTLHERASYQSIPGHPRWMMAPIEMVWQGKSIGEICRQLKDPDRNGGRDLALLHDHLARDDLVASGWQPGAGREPAPGSQVLLGELVQAWIDTGAQCP
jgi:hypothetical protein